jgi:hypothetical protein
MTTPIESSFTSEKLAPDLMRTRIRGDLTADLLEAMVEYSHEVLEVGRPHIAIVDISELGTVTPEARVAAKNVPKRMPDLRGTIMVGGGFMQRMITKLLNIAMNLVSRRQIMLEYVGSDAEALAIADAWRQKLREEQTDG